MFQRGWENNHQLVMVKFTAQGVFQVGKFRLQPLCSMLEVSIVADGWFTEPGWKKGGICR